MVEYEKRDHIVHFHLNMESIAATDLKFGIIVSSFCSIRKEFRAPPISSVGGVSMHVDRISVLCLTLAVHRLGQEACSSF